MTATALYLRVSTGEQDIAGQERELREYAERRGWIVAAVYAEKLSGTGHVERAELERLKRDASGPDRRYDHVLVWALDRWSREPSFVKAIGSIEELERAGIHWHSLREPALDSADDGSHSLARDLLRGILPTIAAFEARRRSERTSLAMQEIKAGRRQTRSGRRPGKQPRLTEPIVRAILAGRARTPPTPYRELAQQLGIRSGTARRAFSLASRGQAAFVTPAVHKGPAAEKGP